MQIRTQFLAALTAAAMVAGSAVPAAATSKSDRAFLKGVAATALVGGLIYYSQQQRAQAQQPSYYAPVTRQATPQQVYRAPAPSQQYATSYRAPVQQSAVAQGFRELTVQQRRTVQQRLQQQGYYQDRIDGVWGPNTQAAVRAYALDSGYRQSLDSHAGAAQVYRSLLY
jgi:hypothetical protein